MKKIIFTLIIVCLAAFIFTSCADTNKQETPTNGQIIWNSLEGDYEEGILFIGYENINAVTKISEWVNGTVSQNIPELKIAAVTFDGTVKGAKSDILKSLSEDTELAKAIRFVEPSIKRELVKDVKPSDDYIESLTQPRTSDFSQYLWGLEKVQAQAAWDMGYTGKGIIVAVVDTGVDYTHPDLAGQCVAGYAPLTDTILLANEDHSQNQYHGTHVSGTIAAKNDGEGITGVAPDAKIMNIRIFEQAGNDKIYVGDLAVAKGLIWAVNQGAHVLNNSWGGKGYSNTLLEAFNYAFEHNVISVIAEGNEHVNGVKHPSAYPGMINVAASTANDGITAFSSRGQWLTVAAPGDHSILSTIPTWLTGVFDSSYAFGGGTSMACPHVSGVVALMIEKLKNSEPTDRLELAYTPYQIRKMLINGAKDIMAKGFDVDSGWGLAQAASSLEQDIAEIGKGATLKIKMRMYNGEDLIEDFQFTQLGLYVSIKPDSFVAPEYYGKTNAAGELTFMEMDPGQYNLYLGKWEVESVEPLFYLSETGWSVSYALTEGENIYYVDFQLTPNP